MLCTKKQSSAVPLKVAKKEGKKAGKLPVVQSERKRSERPLSAAPNSNSSPVNASAWSELVSIRDRPLRAGDSKKRWGDGEGRKEKEARSEVQLPTLPGPRKQCAPRRSLPRPHLERWKDREEGGRPARGVALRKVASCEGTPVFPGAGLNGFRFKHLERDVGDWEPPRPPSGKRTPPSLDRSSPNRKAGETKNCRPSVGKQPTKDWELRELSREFDSTVSFRFDEKEESSRKGQNPSSLQHLPIQNGLLTYTSRCRKESGEYSSPYAAPLLNSPSVQNRNMSFSKDQMNHIFSENTTLDRKLRKTQSRPACKDYFLEPVSHVASSSINRRRESEKITRQNKMNSDRLKSIEDGHRRIRFSHWKT